MKHNLLITSALACVWCACSPSQDTPQNDSSAATSSLASHSNGNTTSHTHEGEVDHHDHLVAGPNGGKLLAKVEPHLEFWIQPEDQHARITYVDDSLKPMEPGNLEIHLSMGDRANPTRVSFEKKVNWLVSNQPLEAAGNPPVILEIRSPDSESVIYERFHLNMDTCPDCQLHEYACICEHEPHEH